MEKPRGSNPFAPGFGHIPPVYIPREDLEEHVIRSFTAISSPQHVFRITGIRGSGKTVLMTCVSQKIAEDPNWLLIDLSPEQDLLHSFAAHLQCDRRLFAFLQENRVSPSPAEHPKNALAQMLEGIEAQGRRVLVTVDEVTDSPNLRRFAGALQGLLQKGLPLHLLMAGLPDNWTALQAETYPSFLRKCPCLTAGPLDMEKMAGRYRQIFHLNQAQARRMAQDTRGYAYAFQLLGWHAWHCPKNPAQVRARFKETMFECVCEKVWKEATVPERQVLTTMARVPGGETEKLRSFVNMGPAPFSACQTGLIRRGIICEASDGRLLFTLPLFEEYIREYGFPA